MFTLTVGKIYNFALNFGEIGELKNVHFLIKTVEIYFDVMLRYYAAMWFLNI